ncbi:heat shock protein 91 [Striga asiatica]|uniref:Heat shock protein 91 n=1 Tax=Striga asiatica TaxID=4170 RepID=A0A5A7PZ23_STRAF|nr:heat shock protein 91 [Striga asiatica]
MDRYSRFGRTDKDKRVTTVATDSIPPLSSSASSMNSAIAETLLAAAFGGKEPSAMKGTCSIERKEGQTLDDDAQNQEVSRCYEERRERIYPRSEAKHQGYVAAEAYRMWRLERANGIMSRPLPSSAAPRSRNDGIVDEQAEAEYVHKREKAEWEAESRERGAAEGFGERKGAFRPEKRKSCRLSLSGERDLYCRELEKTQGWLQEAEDEAEGGRRSEYLEEAKEIEEGLRQELVEDQVGPCKQSFKTNQGWARKGVEVASLTSRCSNVKHNQKRLLPKIDE